MTRINEVNDLQKRQEPRQDVRLSIRTDEGEGLNELMLNYSLSGCCITSPVIFKKGDLVTIDISQIKDNLKINKNNYKVGLVVWEKNEKYEQSVYGIKFYHWMDFA